MFKNTWINVCIGGGLMFFIATMISSDNTFAEARNSVTIEENVSATANSGENIVEGSGEIQTGNASASSSSITTIKGSGEAKVDVKTKAEANGKKVEAEAKEGNLKENISVQKEIKDDGAEAKVDIDIDMSEENGANTADQNENTKKGQSANEENKNIFSRITVSISNTARGFWEGIMLLFE